MTTLKALADETRLKLIHLLLNQNLCGRALAQHLGISEAAVSQHLKVLKEAGIVEGEKRGYWTHYSIEKSALEMVISELQGITHQSVTSNRSCHRVRAGNLGYSVKEVKTMCQSCCERPDKLKGKPEQCTPEQIRECHGDVKKHPCEEKKRNPDFFFKDLLLISPRNIKRKYSFSQRDINRVVPGAQCISFRKRHFLH